MTNHRLKLEFPPRRLYLWAPALMQGHRDEPGKDLSLHDFCKAACTQVAEKDIHTKRAAVAIDMTAEMVLRYYTAAEKKRTADEVLGDLASDLLPKPKAQTGR